MPISGTGLALATAGGVLLWSGLSGVTPLDLVKNLTQPGAKLPPIHVGSPTEILGQLATSTFSTAGGILNSSYTTGSAGPVPASSELGARIAAAAERYAGRVPYKWGGATPSGWDCSGMVTYVLHHDLGLNLPSNTHTVSQQFYVWSGATDVPASQCQAGDLVCWLSHIAIATGPTTCVGAENPRSGTVEGPISQMGPGNGETYVIRRVKAQSTTNVQALAA